jgi:hypothetical protein
MTRDPGYWIVGEVDLLVDSFVGEDADCCGKDTNELGNLNKDEY